jgi:hypothetical protein
MILGVALLSQGVAAFPFKIDRGGVKEEQIHSGEKVAVGMKEVFFDDVLDAPGSKRRSVLLILSLLSQKGHGPIQMMQTKRFNSVNTLIPAPLIARPVGAGNEQAMQNRQKDGSFHIKLEFAVAQNAMKNLADPHLLPKPLKDHSGADLLCRGLNIGVTPGGKNQEDLFGETGQRPYDGFDIAVCAKLIHPAYGGDNPLADFLSFPAILDKLEVFVAA